MKRLPRGTKAQIMGTRLFQTMYTADQMRKAVADELEACALIVENEAAQYVEPVWALEIVNDIRERENK